MSSQPVSVEAEVAFVNEEWRDADEMPLIFDRESRLRATTRRTVAIHDARVRHARGELSLDDSGFVLVDHATASRDYRDKAVVQGEYFPEMKSLLLALTGATDAFAFPFYQVRSREPEHFFDAFSLYMHCDYSPDTIESFPRYILKENDALDAYPAESWDYAWYNLWRPIGGVVKKNPLVVMDASTLKREDIINYSASKDRKGYAAVPLFEQAQRLYYVPDMRPDEVLVIKQMDTRKGRAFVSPHTSFDDPSSPDDAPERESIDIRFMCVFPKEP